MTLRDLNIVADALAYSIESLEIAIPASDISSVERGDEWLGTIARFPQLRDVTIHPRFRHSSEAVRLFFRVLPHLEEKMEFSAQGVHVAPLS
jgi:hypothetical protein